MIRTAILSLALLAGGVVAATAQPLPPGGPSHEEVAAWLQGEGLDAVVSRDDDGTWVASGANGVSWELSGYDCEAGRCGAWQFSAAFLADAVDAAAVNRWNRERRYLRAFTTSFAEGDGVVVQHDVLVTPGMGWEAMTQHMRLFAGAAPLFATHIGYVPSAPAEQ